MKQDREIENGRDALKKDGSALDLRRASLEAEEKGIGAQRSLVDAKSQKSIDDFNAAATAHTRNVNDYNEAVHAFTVREAGVNGVVNAFNTGCAGHSYYADDMDAVTAELGPNHGPPILLPPPPTD